MRISAIVVAAGSGQRLGLNQAKAFVEISGRPILFYCLSMLRVVPDLTEIVITYPDGGEVRTREIAQGSGLELPIKLVRGGIERQDSVRAALEFTSAESEIVIIHDAARPLAESRLFIECIAKTRHADGAIAAIPVSDTLKQVENGAITATRQRAGLFQAQTPQAFRREILIRAHQQAAIENFAATDDADLVERVGGKVAVVEGSPRNLKITTREDLAIAEALLRSV